MSQALIDELNRENLCTHFVLPLLKLSKFSYISSNFVNSYLSVSGTSIYVQIVEPMFLSRGVLGSVYCMGIKVRKPGELYVAYHIPRKWKKDVKLFMEGKFSQMSKGAKEQIVRHSRLPNKELNDVGQAVTDGRLLALTKHHMLREMWERELSTGVQEYKPGTGQVELSEEDELLGIPGKESYIDPQELSPMRKSQL